MTLPDRPPPPAGRAGWWWQLAVATLVAPFYVGLYLVTLLGGAFDRKHP